MKSNINKKTYNFIITILILIFITLLLSIYKDLRSAKSLIDQQKIKNLKSESVQVINTIKKDWTAEKENLLLLFQKENKRIVLTGTQGIKYSISTNDKLFDYKGNDNKFIWLAGKLNSLRVKTLTVNATYSFDLAYDESDMRIEVDDNGVVTIELYMNDLSLRPISEITKDTTLQTEMGVLSNEFTPVQINSVKALVQQSVWDYLKNYEPIFQKALTYEKDVITEKANEFEFTEVNFVVNDGFNRLVDDDNIELVLK